MVGLLQQSNIETTVENENMQALIAMESEARAISPR